MKKTNEKGFSVVEVIMAIVIVVLIGVVGYMWMQANQKKDNSTVKTASTSASPSTMSFNQKESDAAAAHIKAFYQKYLSYLNGTTPGHTAGEYDITGAVKDGFVTQ